mgnify:FL=1
MPRLREEKRLREQRILGIKTGIPTYVPPELTVRGFKLVFYNTSQMKVGELGADVQFGKLSEIEFELLPTGCGAFSFVLDSLPTFPVGYRTRVDVHPYFDATPWFSGFIQTIPKPGQRPPFRYLGFGFFEQLDWVLVTRSYQNQELSLTIKDIVENIVAPSTQIAYNASKIETTSYTVTDIAFDNVRAKDAIQQLANLAAGYEFGVDNTREFYFRAESTAVNYHYWAGKHFQDLDLEEDPLPIRNKLYVKSGKIQTDGSNLVGTVSDPGSISTYGLREEVVTAPDVLDNDDALEWAEQILAEKKNPKIKARIRNVIVDQTKTKIEAAGKIRITAHEDTTYELSIDRILYHISADGILAEIDCEKNPHPLEELLTEEIKTADDEQRLSDKRTKELYDLIGYIQAATGNMVVPSDVSESAGNFINVTGLSFSVEANKIYGFRFVLKSAAGAWRLRFTGPESPVIFWAEDRAWTSGNTWWVGRASAFNSNFGGATMTADSEQTIDGFLVNGSNAGTVQLQMKTNAPPTAFTIKQGSWGTWKKLN